MILMKWNYFMWLYIRAIDDSYDTQPVQLENTQCHATPISRRNRPKTIYTNTFIRLSIRTVDII